MGSVRKSTEDITYSSQEAVGVFRLLREGRTLEEIVLEKEFHPALVQVIAKDYQAVSGAILITKPVVDEINKLSESGLDGSFPVRSGEEILELLKEAADQRCSGCGKRKRSQLCGRCVRSRFAAEAAASEAPIPAEESSPPTSDGEDHAETHPT